MLGTDLLILILLSNGPAPADSWAILHRAHVGQLAPLISQAPLKLLKDDTAQICLGFDRHRMQAFGQRWMRLQGREEKILTDYGSIARGGWVGERRQERKIGPRDCCDTYLVSLAVLSMHSDGGRR